MLSFETIASSSAGCCYRLSSSAAKRPLRPLLLDCGIPFPRLRSALDFRVSELAGCLVSHAHQDHCRAAAPLAANGIDIYASKPTLDALGQATTRPYRMHAVDAGCWRNLEGQWSILPFDVVHDCPGTFGFLVRSPEGSLLLYLTDACYVTHRFPPVDYIAVECNHSEAILRANVEAGSIDPERFMRTSRSHMSLERLLEMLAANDLSRVRQIWLLHLSDANSDEAAFQQAIERATGIPCEVAPKKTEYYR